MINRNADLKREIKILRTQFKKQEYELEHGVGTFFEDDVDDLYAVDKKHKETVSRSRRRAWWPAAKLFLTILFSCTHKPVSCVRRAPYVAAPKAGLDATRAMETEEHHFHGGRAQPA